MSMSHIVKATCPDCKKEFPLEVWQSVNVQLNPEMREKVLDGSIFQFECPHCGMKGHTEYPFLYNDMKHGFMIQYCSEDDVDKYTKSFEELVKSDAATGALNNEYLRIVTEYFWLTEKIKILENGFDDRLIELLKLWEVKELNHNKPENDLAFALFDMLPNKDLKKKEPIPTLVYINRDGEKAFDCPLCIIPGALSQIKENYDYLSDKSFIVNYEWAGRYIYHEKISSSLFNVKFDQDEFSEEGAGIADYLIDLLTEEDMKKSLRDYLKSCEEKYGKKHSFTVSKDSVNDALKAFFRYTNFQKPLEEMRDDPRFPWRDQIGFNFERIDMNDFYEEYFFITAELFETLVIYFIQALIHGAVYDPDYPLDFTIESRDKEIRSSWLEEMNGEKENDTRVLKEYYKYHEKDATALAYKNCCVRYIYQYELPEDDVLRFDPPITKEMWYKYENRPERFYDANHPLTEEEKAQVRENSLKLALEIWKVSYSKYDIAKCFAEIANYFWAKGFYQNEEYRKAYINAVISGAYHSNSFGIPYIKKQYKGEISKDEFKKYEIETGLPTHANEEIQDLIMKRLDACKKSDDKFGQVYYLNLMYNFTDEKTDSAKSIDATLNDLLREIDL